MKTRTLFCMAALLAAVSCGKTEALEPETDTQQQEQQEPYNENPVTPAADFQTNSQNVSYADAVVIAYNTDGTVAVTNPYAAGVVDVVASGQHVTATATVKDVTYVLSGTTSNGSFKVYSTNKFNLVLNGVSIWNPTGAAINNQASKTVTLTLVDLTNNRLIDGTTYTTVGEEDMKGTFFSEGQVVFGGNGSLLVYGNYKHAICVDNYIIVNSGKITINNAASDGIHCNKYFQMEGGTVTIEAASDCIESEKEGGVLINGGTLNAVSTGIGGKCLKSSTDINVTGGTLTLKSVGNGGKCLKSDVDIALSGGTLNLTTTGNAYYDTTDKDISSPGGIKCDGNFEISGNCALTINSSGSAGKGISIDGTVIFNGGVTNITTSGAIYKYSSTLDSSAKAVKAQGNMTVNSGVIKIKTSKDGAEGLESKAVLTINGGLVEIEAYDDAINAATNITINGGEVYCYSSGNDGIDSNGTLTITGGVVVSSGTSSPEDGLDCDQNTLKITGGIVVGVGGSTSSPTASACTQRVFVWGTSSFTSGQFIGIEDSSGKNVLTFKMPRAYSGNMALFFTSPDLANGTYTVYKGGSASGGTDFHGLYTGASYTKGTSATTFTFSGTTMVTTVGTINGGGGGGNPGGGGKPF